MYNVFDSDKIESIIGYKFKDKALLRRAFTHSSSLLPSYDRLEFLGDSFLSFVVADTLYKKYNFEASDMTVLRSKLVSLIPLSTAVERLGLHKYIICSDYKDVVEAKGKKDNKTKSDIFESVLGAILLDGGSRAATAFIKQNLKGLSDVKLIKDYRTQFKERFIDKQKLDVDYRYSRDRELHIAEILVDGRVVGRGKGRTKDEAKENASKEAILQLD